MFEWMLLGLPLLVGLATTQAPPAADATGASGSTTLAPPADPAPDPGAGLQPAPAPEAAKKPEETPVEEPSTVEIPADEVLAIERDREELARRRAENARLRDRARTRREKTPAEPATQPLTADTIAEAMLKALGQMRPSDRPTIPGLKYEADGEVTYQGRSIDPDVASLLVESRRDGDTMRETVERLEAHQADIDARFAADDEAAEVAAIAAVEARHIGRMEDYGVSLADQRFAHLDEGMRELARDNFYAGLGKVLNQLDERGITPEEITPELIARVAKPLIEKIEKQLGGATTRAQAAATADARDKEPLRRGGSVAAPGRPDPAKLTTPKEREEYAEQLARELADTVHGAGSRPGTVEEGYPNY